MRWDEILIFHPWGFHLFVCAQVKKSLAEIGSQEVEELRATVIEIYKAGIQVSTKEKGPDKYLRNSVKKLYLRRKGEF